MAANISLGGTVLVLTTSSIIYFLIRLYQHRTFYAGLPKPPHSFIWGHLKLLGEVTAEFPHNTHPQAYYTAIARKYDLKGLFYLDLWPIASSQVVLNDPELQEYVNVKKPLQQHHSSADFLGPIVGDQVIAVVNGPLWKSLHNAMSPAFSMSHIRSITGLIVDQCLLFQRTLDKYAETGEVFSMEKASAKLSFDIIALLVFNFPLHAQTQGSQHLADLHEMIALAEAQLDVVKKLNLWWQVKTYSRRRAVLGRLHPWINNQILDRYNLLLRDGIVPSRKNPVSILDLMLRDKVQDSEGKTRARRRENLTSQEIRVLTDNVKGLLVGGSGTSTDTLCFICMLLSKNPDVLTRLRSEHDDVFDRDSGETMRLMVDAPDKLSHLPYTEGVIKESLRLFPVGFGVRAALAGDQISFNGQSYPIDNDLAVVSNGADVHYNPKYFPDPTKFQPERWVDPDNEIPRSYFRSFGRGPRGCLGQNLAMHELKVILVMTIRQYDFSCANLKPNAKPRAGYTDLDTIYGDVIFQELGLEAKPRGGVPMTVAKRSRKR